MMTLDEHKKKLENDIVETIIRALEEGKIEEIDLGKISKFVLEGIDKAATEEDITKFLNELAGKWEFFRSFVVLDQSANRELQEEESVKNVLSLLESGNLDSALELAKSATHSQ